MDESMKRLANQRFTGAPDDLAIPVIDSGKVSCQVKLRNACGSLLEQ